MEKLWRYYGRRTVSVREALRLVILVSLRVEFIA